MPPSCRGLTFLELLVAVAVALLVVTIALAVWQIVLSNSADQARRRDVVLPADLSVQELARDLTCALTPFSEGSNTMTLAVEPMPGSTQTASVLSFFTAQPDSNEHPDPRAYSVAEARYFVEASNKKTGAFSLMREYAPVFPAGRPEQMECAQNICGFDVLFMGADNWTNAWAATELPKLAKIRLSVLIDGISHQIETVAPIPAGMRIEPPATNP